MCVGSETGGVVLEVRLGPRFKLSPEVDNETDVGRRSLKVRGGTDLSDGAQSVASATDGAVRELLGQMGPR